ncbi:membrane-bound NADP+-reducing complex MBX, subunit MbxG [Candidatus Vecturithrix granuli]|uniref:Membrane-bound NADP+-reducing complex MBX, subunit MbxG n=1 Tax=Vecturithrix granuli TaxID=1499967 RepID=A0A081BUC1_VECG1|nr:membrane-bound NADP+-reducing complex MBX, subunit MbxG [Candidatus Vecturithrix granuli]
MATYTSIVLMLIGLYGLMAKRNLIKKIIGLYILEGGVILYFISVGYRSNANAPILEHGMENVVDPVPQALMLTAIVIGICVTALALSIAVKIYENYHTLDVEELKRHL